MRILAPLVLVLLATFAHAEPPLRIAVAVSFKPTLEKISRQFEANTGIRVALSSASTGTLATQILYGAPFDIFFAADRETPQKIQSRRDTKNSNVFCYAFGSLVLAGSSGDLSALGQATRSLAIANPATAPYGRAAMQVLARPEFSAAAARKIVRGNNVAQAYQFWASNTVDLALLPRALAPQDALQIPQKWHAPIAHYAIVLQSSAALDTYLKWIRSATVRALITQSGYRSCP